MRFVTKSRIKEDAELVAAGLCAVVAGLLRTHIPLRMVATICMRRTLSVFVIPEKKTMKPEKGYCINCDNRHGCKSQAPPCVSEMKARNITGSSGKQYFIDNNKAAQCNECDFFRSCWSIEEYNRILRR